MFTEEVGLLNVSEQQMVTESGLRGVLKVYAARDYKDDRCRRESFVEVNAPEFFPTMPQNAKHVNIVVPNNYFANANFPTTRETLKSLHYLRIELLEGSRCPARFNKGAEFMLLYIGGKIEEGRLVFIRDREASDEEEFQASEWDSWEDRVNMDNYDYTDLDNIGKEASPDNG